MLLSYNADILPRVRMLGHIHYQNPWMHFARKIDEFVLYAIQDGDMYLQEDGIDYHLTSGDIFILEPELHHRGYQKAACDYYSAHFTHSEMFRMPNDEAAMALLAEKRKRSLISYNLDKEDPTDPITFLPKHFHLFRGEFKILLRSAIEIYN